MTAHGIQSTLTRMMAPFLDKSRGLLLFLFFAVGLGVAGPGLPHKTMARSSRPRIGREIAAHAQAQSNPVINLSDGREIEIAYAGPANLVQMLQENQAKPLAMATADFDEDGVPDLIVGYAAGDESGIVSLLRGNIDAIYPNSPDAKKRKEAGTFTPNPFLSPAQLFPVSQAPDFIGAGDFDGDGHPDVVIAKRGGDSLDLLSGDGKGGWSSGKSFHNLTGTVMTMTVGEIDRRDGLDDVVVGIKQYRNGFAQVLAFEGPKGAFNSPPQRIDLPANVPATESFALALGQFDDEFSRDLAVAVGTQLWVLQGLDRKLSVERYNAGPRTGRTRPTWISNVTLQSKVKAIESGYFFDNYFGDSTFYTRSLALLLQDGSVYLHVPKLADPATQIEPYSKKLWNGAVGLVNVRVTGEGHDDLAILGNDFMHIAKFDEKGMFSEVTCPSTPCIKMTEAPVAALSMRLNENAMSDIVFLQQGKTAVKMVASSPGMTFTVDSTEDHMPHEIENGCGDGRHCTLREAILAANRHPGLNKITFNLTGTPPYTISLNHFLDPGLPNGFTGDLVITDPVTIDGTTQREYSSGGKPVVVLDYTQIAPYFGAISIYTKGDTVVRGLAMRTTKYQFYDAAIYIEIANNNVIEGNYIGIDQNGARATVGYAGINIARVIKNKIGGTVPAARNILSGHQVNFWANNMIEALIQGNYIGVDDTGSKSIHVGVDLGILMGGVNNTIGGTAPGARNMISTQSDNIILYSGGGNLVQGNYVGLLGAGEGIGVSMEASSRDNTIGGAVPEARNIISGRSTAGIQIFGQGSVNNYVQGNYIGTDVKGEKPLPNGKGISIGGTANTYILDNVISGNTLDGIFLNFLRDVTGGRGPDFHFENSTGAVVQRNLIGTDHTGNLPLGNGGHGIQVVNKNQVHQIENNLMAYNRGTGIFIPDGEVPGFQILISENSIFGNGGIGIALNTEGGSRNDQRLGNKRANQGQNYPKLKQILSDGQSTVITGTLASPPPEGFRLEFFSNGIDRCEPQGRLFLHAATISSNDVAADGSFMITFPKSVDGGYINCTATSGTSGIGNTSEFSDCVRLQGPIIQEVTVTANQIAARGLGFVDPVQIFLDNVGFKTKAALQSDGRGVIQTGLLVDGRSIGEAIPPGRTVRIRFQNGNGGLIEIPFKY